MMYISTGRTGICREPKWCTDQEFMLSNRRIYTHGQHGRTAFQDAPKVQRIPRRAPNPHPRQVREFESRVQVARRWILDTIKDFFKGAFYAPSEGIAVDILNKKVRPRNTRLGHGKDRHKVISAAFRGLVKDGHINYVEDRATYGLVPA